MRRDLRLIVLIREDLKVICWRNYKGSTFYSVMLRPLVLVRPNSRPPAWQPDAQPTTTSHRNAVTRMIKGSADGVSIGTTFRSRSVDCERFCLSLFLFLLLLLLVFAYDVHKIICSVYAAWPVFIYDVGIWLFCNRAAASVFVYVLVTFKKSNEVKRTINLSPHQW